MSHDGRLRDLVQDATRRLSEPGDDEWHTLVEAGPAALKYVLEAFEGSEDRGKKLALLSVISEYRAPQALDLLARTLKARYEEMWKLALDGLVTLGGDSARRVLVDALNSAEPRKREWIDEALEQIE